MREMILASASPRRKELLAQIGFDFQVMPAQKEEKITKKTPAEIVEELSYQKAMEVAGKVPSGLLVIGADTMVFMGQSAMGKPKSEEDAVQMLTRLQGETHQVCTGVTVVIREGEDYEYFTFSECTEIELFPMTLREIRDYVKTGDSADKAGAYGIQGIFARHVKAVRGDYNNVVGLPAARLYQELRKRELL